MEIQVWTTLTALFLLKWLDHLSLAVWSLSNLTAMLRLNFFTYRKAMKQTIVIKVKTLRWRLGRCR
ncbi:hypothetical protein DFAR_2570008 [Desulfarculales bacterium]